MLSLTDRVDRVTRIVSISASLFLVTSSRVSRPTTSSDSKPLLMSDRLSKACSKPSWLLLAKHLWIWRRTAYQCSHFLFYSLPSPFLQQTYANSKTFTINLNLNWSNVRLKHGLLFLITEVMARYNRTGFVNKLSRMKTHIWPNDFLRFLNRVHG